MEELAKKIKETIEVFNTNLDANVGGNKAAGLRARKASLELEKLLKQYRKISIEATKA
ncbi:MAG: histone H1 [Lachnospiraceae bacterium]|nr:histone H1 [Lachnospiraceae bacterium]